MHVLVVEDDPAMGAFLTKGLRSERHEVVWFPQGDAAVACARLHRPDLLILNMDQAGSARILEEVHRQFQHMAVLALTSSDKTSDRVRWLDMGADDCLTKPFSFEEMRARCGTLLRRQRSSGHAELAYGKLTMNMAERRARYGTCPLDLTATELQLLWHLLKKRGECCARAELLGSVWNSRPDTITNVVNVYVNTLRQKITAAQQELGEDPPGLLIETVRGHGYRLRLASTPASPLDAPPGALPETAPGTSASRGSASNLLLRKPQRKEFANTRPWLSESTTPGRRVLIVSANESLRGRVMERLTSKRWQASDAWGGAEAMGYLGTQLFDIVVVDHWLPDLEVGYFREELARLYPSLSVLPMDGVSELRGVGPWERELIHDLRYVDNDDDAGELVLAHKPAGTPGPTALLERPVPAPAARATMAKDFAAASADAEDWTPIDGMIGSSLPMRRLTRLIRMVAPQRATVLIEGETGTGKEVVAQAIHALSERSKKKLVILNCSTIPEALLETELFGHIRGAFTGATASRIGKIEAAHGGTLFLDEIGELPLSLQAKLLRFLENGEVQRVGSNEIIKVDARVLAATHKPLEALASRGQFRLDLYHRLAVFPIEVPSLIDRIEDIPVLAEHFLAARSRNGKPKRLTPETLQLMLTYAWPGNVRELAHVLERAVILAGKAESIEPDHLLLSRRERD